jgi:hypothetical protein
LDNIVDGEKGRYDFDFRAKEMANFYAKNKFSDGGRFCSSHVGSAAFHPVGSKAAFSKCW